MRRDEELLALASELKTAAAKVVGPAYEEPTTRLMKAAADVGRAASGSWLGYQSRVYYDGLRDPPPGAHFSVEWGLKELLGDMGTRGRWREYDPAQVRARVRSLAGDPDLAEASAFADECRAAFDRCRDRSLQILDLEAELSKEPYLERLHAELEDLKPVSDAGAARALCPSGKIISRDALALGQGIWVPPHLQEVARVLAMNFNNELCARAADIVLRAGSFMERKRKSIDSTSRVGTNVFIGHGRSGARRELKDFVKDRMALPHDEFNRVPVAGVTNIARLSEMLDAAAIAFVIMTAEDETAEGMMQARMNVIHEVGLFQGRLGFTKAIVLLEEGCAEFTNIQGLGQIRFPQGRISAAFEDVRQVLEREGLVQPA